MKKQKIIPIKPVSVVDETDQSEENMSLYAAHKKIRPRKISGWYNNWRWAFVWLTQLIFFGVPWLTWDGRQAFLVDITNHKIYVWGLVLLPQDLIYLAALLVVSALGLFLFTAIAGRLFCGYACPQTVYTEIFMWIEQKIEGDWYKQQRLDQSKLTFKKFSLKSLKLSLWFVVALWSGFTFVAYFTPAHVLWQQTFIEMHVVGWDLFWMLFYAGFMVLQAGFMREQVCKYMCPYARFQSAMLDKDTMIVTYDAQRGETRGARKKEEDYKAKGLGDCIDCGVCVQVCPVGIDIRKGLQYECIGCGLCIDACDQMMDKMNYPRGLIRYTTENGLLKKLTRRQIWKRVLRPRVLIYTAILIAITSVVTGTIAMRDPIRVSILRDRGVLGREVEDGLIENLFRIRVQSALEEKQQYQISATGIETLRVVGAPEISIDALGNNELVVKFRVDPNRNELLKPGSHKFEIILRNKTNPTIEIHEKAVFIIPR